MRSCLLVVLMVFGLHGFSQERIEDLERLLSEMADSLSPGLNEEIEIAVMGASIQQFVRAVAAESAINVNVDPRIGVSIYNNFSGESAKNILLFLCQEYELDIRVVGSIISLFPYKPPPPILKPYVPKPLDIQFDATTGLLRLDLEQDSLIRVAEKLTVLTQANIVLSPAVKSRRVDAYLEDVSLEAAMEHLAYANGLSTEMIRPDYYQVSVADPVKSGNGNQARTGGRSDRNQTRNVSDGRNAGDIAFSARQTRDGRQLISVESQNVPIGELIEQVAYQTGTNYLFISEIQGTATMGVEDVSFETFLSYVLRGTDYSFIAEDSIYLVGSRGLESLRSYVVHKLQFRTAEDVLALIPQEVAAGVEIKLYSDLNALILSGSTPNIRETQAVIRSLDEVVPMVLIEVTVLDIRKGRNVSTGVTAGLGDSVRTGGTLLPGLDFTLSSRSINDLLSILDGTGAINLGRVAPDFYIGLQAIEDNQNIDIRSTPRLATINGKQATLSIGETSYYLQQQRDFISNTASQTTITDRYVQEQADLSVTITPVVSGDESVTLQVSVSISELKPSINVNAPRGTTSQNLTSTIRVRNEEMIVLGGLEKKATSRGSQGLPFVSRIPVLKWLFGNQTRGRTENKFLIFIRPTVIY